MGDIEYLALGGVEIGNNARAYSYAQCISCCAGLLKCPGCDGIHDATSPWDPAVFGWTPLATNLATNPSMETASGTVEVRRNWLLNPRMDNSVVDWSVVGTGVTQTAAAGGTRIDFASALATAAPFLYNSAVVASANAETVYAGIDVTVPAGFPAVTLAVSIRGYLTGGSSADTSAQATGSTVTVQPGQTVRLVSPIASGTATTVGGWRLWLNLVSPGAGVGARITVRNAIIEKIPGNTLPYFDGGWAPRYGRNLAPNPAVGNAAGWYSNDGTRYPGTTDTVFSRRAGTNSKRFDRASASPSASLMSAYSVGGLTWATGQRSAVEGGKTYTFSVYAATDATDSPRGGMSIAWYDSAGVLIGTVVSSPTVEYAGVGREQWFRVTYTAVAPATAVQAGISSVIVSLPLFGVSVGGERTWITDAQIEEGSVASEYSDGAYAPSGFTPAWEGTAHASASYITDNDFTVSWTGTANNSASILTAPGIATLDTASPERARRIQSSQWASTGSKSVRVIAYQGVSYAEFQIPDLIPGRTYTVMGKIRLSAVQTGTLNGSARSITMNNVVGSQSSTQAPNQIGVWDVRCTFSLTSGTVGRVRLWNGAAVGGGDVWWDDLILVEGDYNGAYFDGSFPDVFDSEGVQIGDYGWNGADHASTSFYTQYTLLTPAGSSEPEYNCDNLDRAPWYDDDLDASQRFIGSYLLSVSGLTDSTMSAPVVEGMDDGGVVGVQRYSTRAVRIRTLLIGCGQDAAEYGLAWLKAVLGDTYCGKHGEACGTSDLDFFIDCPPSLLPDDTDYDAKVARYRRSLHSVVCTSGPVTQEEWLTDSGAYGIVVEFILTSESPFVWGETIPVVSAGSTLTAFDDVASNLMRYPSAEVLATPPVPVVVATNFAYNGSAEYGGANPTGWAIGTAPANATLTGGQSLDIAAVGPNSYRARLVATGVGTDQTILLYYPVTLNGAGGNTPPLPAGAKPSVSMWGRIHKQVGAPVIDRFYGYVEWRDASTVLGTTQLGDVAVDKYGGWNFIVTGLTVPSGSLTARLVLAAQLDYVAADEIRMYGDAFALTVP